MFLGPPSLTRIPYLLHQRPLHWSLHYNICALPLTVLLGHIQAKRTFGSHSCAAHPNSTPIRSLLASLISFFLPYIPLHPLHPRAHLFLAHLRLLFIQSFHSAIFTLLNLFNKQFPRFPVPDPPYSLNPASSSVLSAFSFSPKNCPINAQLSAWFPLTLPLTLKFLTPPGCDPGLLSPSLCRIYIHHQLLPHTLSIPPQRIPAFQLIPSSALVHTLVTSGS